MGRKWIGIMLVSLLAVCTANATRWNQDVAVGAKWSETSSWEGGALPTSGDLALFQLTQANTYDVDVDTSGVTRLLQVMQAHTFNGSGSVYVTTTAGAQFQSTILNTITGTVTYNVPITVNISSTSDYYGGVKNNNGGTTVFNDAFTLEAGTGKGVNLDIGTFEFNGDFILNDYLRLGSGTMKIGGSGTTSIGSPGYILTAGPGTELHLDRAGAYTLADPSTGYLRLEKSKVIFNAANACGAGTNVKLYQLDDGSMLVSGGDYDQNFGWLASFGTSTATDIDMANTACTWTFADSSDQGWNDLTIENVDVPNTVIRFELGTGGGLTDAQIGKITLNGTVLSPGDTTEENGYLYITPMATDPSIVTWKADVDAGAAWSAGSNWVAGTAPVSTNIAVFENEQSNTYDVDVDTAAAVRELQVKQAHTFSGSGSLSVTTEADTLFQNSVLNSTAGTVTYDVPFTVTIDGSSYGQMANSGIGTSVFNDAFTLAAGAGNGLNLDQGVFEFNGDLTLNDTLRLGSGTMVIGGSGTTSIGGSGYILTSGAGTELHLDRTGAYTVADPGTGYLRMEKTKVVFNAENACGAGTNIRMYQTAATSMLVSGGDYDQTFGWLGAYATNTATDIDMANSACMWTFADTSSQGWNSLTIDNVHLSNTVIRFEIGSGSGLTASQIGKITMNGSPLTTGDTTVSGGYLYITPALEVPVLPPEQPGVVGVSMVSGDVMKMVISAPSEASRYSVEGTSGLLASWSAVAHSDDGVNPFIVTNLEYATTEGSNAVIYVQTTNSVGFFQIIGE